jgi:glycosyltransferase involved in cell wall biosynthesis
VKTFEFPTYSVLGNTATDSFLIDKFCHELAVDVFTSTYYTTPVTIPSVLLVYDMIPEEFGFDLTQRIWQEKQIAISFASQYVCISEKTRSDLKRFYASIDNDRTIVTSCGVEHNIFRPRKQDEVLDFRKRFGISKPYYLIKGLGKPHRSGENRPLVFAAAQRMRNQDFEFVCLGTDREVPRDLLDHLQLGVSVRRMDLTDDDLACALAGGEAAIHTSPNEGHEMLLLEAMACGCPVIASGCSAFGENYGDALIAVSGHSRSELRRAMETVREPKKRKILIERGLRVATGHTWDSTANGLLNGIKRACEERQSPAMRAFFEEWRRLRAIQAEVDVSLLRE